MRRAVVILVPFALLLVACRPGVTMWEPCSAPGDRTGTDGTYALVCKDGVWIPVMTNAEYLAALRKQKVDFSPLPTRPTPTTSTTTTSTTSTTTTSTTTSTMLPPAFASVVIGYDHACGLTTAGGVKCWGSNGFGQLGDGTTTASLTPVAVTGLSSSVTSISSGPYSVCALTSAGAVKCWGYNSFSQLGDGTDTHRSTPVDVVGLSSGVASISVGATSACVATTGGGAKCWGFNGNGQLGTGNFTASSTPVDVSGLTSGVASISIGTYHACAVTTGGAAKCWGYNGHGRLGENNASSVNRTSAVDVVGLTSGVASISAGDVHTCAVTTSGGAKCWGSNNAGRVGDGTTTHRLAPVDVTGLTSGVASIDTGGSQTCAATTAGGAVCWGSNTYGQIGDGTSGTNRTTPAQVSGLTSGVASVSAGQYGSCASLSAGGARCWGYNLYGQLGNASTADSNVPVTVASA